MRKYWGLTKLPNRRDSKRASGEAGTKDLSFRTEATGQRVLNEDKTKSQSEFRTGAESLSGSNRFI